MRRPAILVAAAAAAALAAVAPAAAQDHGAHGGGGGGGDHGAATSAAAVSILHASVTPPQVNVLVGETVTWTNDSLRRHTVTGDDGKWTSDTLFGGDTYRHRFDATGAYGYYCKLHAGIRGEIGAYRVLLDKPKGAAAPGRAFTLTGRTSAAEGTPIDIEADAGDGFRRVAGAEAGADGHFTARISPRTTATLRAVAAGDASPAVQLVVLDRKLATRVVRRGSHTRVRVHVTPAARRGHVVLQARLPERFGWWPLATARLDAASRATFTFGGRRAVTARVVLTLPDGATPLAVGPTFRTRIAR